MGIWNEVDKIDSPLWESVTILNSITYKSNYGPTPSLDIVNAWELITSNWEHFTYEWEDLVL